MLAPAPGHPDGGCLQLHLPRWMNLLPHGQCVYQVVRRGLQLIGILPHHYAEAQPEVDSLQLQTR